MATGSPLGTAAGSGVFDHGDVARDHRGQQGHADRDRSQGSVHVPDASAYQPRRVRPVSDGAGRRVAPPGPRRGGGRRRAPRRSRRAVGRVGRDRRQRHRRASSAAGTRSPACATASADGMPHGARTTTSGSVRSTSSQVEARERPPGSPSSGSPPAAEIDVGDPVAGGVRRVEPLEHERRHRRAAADRLPHGIQPAVQAGDELAPPLRLAGGIGHIGDRRDHLVESLWLERDDVRRAADSGQCRLHVAGRHRAHPAQVLGQQQLGRDLGDRLVVEAIQPAVRGLGSHPRVDVARRQPGRLARTDDDALVAGCRRRVALIGHAEEAVVEAEGEHDLRGRRQERHDPHRPMLVGIAERSGPGAGNVRR